MARRNYVAPDGAVYEVDEAKAPPAWRPETPEEAARAAAGQQPGKAFTEGVLRSATFGLSDAVGPSPMGGPRGPLAGQVPIDPAVEQQARQLRQEENPLASGAGEIAGFLTPGPGLAVKAGKAAGARFAGKGAQRIVAGGTEGSLFGMGTAISENNLGDPKLHGENIAAGVLGGALLGAGVTSIFGKIGDVGKSALMKAFGGTSLQKTLKEAAENTVMRSITNPSDMGKKQLRDRASDVGRFAIDEGFTKGAPSFATAAERAATRADRAFKDMESALDVADTLGAGVFDAAAAAKRLQPLVDDLARNPAMASERKALQGFVDELGATRTVPMNAYMTMNVPGPNAPRTFTEAWKIAKSMLKKAGDKQTPDTLKGELFKLRGEFQEAVADQLTAVHPQTAAAFKQASSEYGMAASFRDLALKKADAAGRGLAFPDLVYGAAGFAAGGPMGLGAAVVSKLGRERGGFVAASALEMLGNSQTLPKIAKGFLLATKVKLGTPGFGGAFRATLESAAAEGAMELMQTHLALSSNPEYMAAVGLEHEDPSTAADYADRAHRFAQISDQVEGVNQEVERSVGRLLGEQPGRPPSAAVRQPTREEFDSLTAKLKALTGHASPRTLSDLAPTTAGLAQLTVATAAQHLLDSAPKDPTAGLPPALRRPWAPSKGDLMAWFHRVDAVADPLSVLNSARVGTVSSEALETLGVVYPRLMQDFRDKIQARLSEWDRPMDRKLRSRISQIVGDFDDPAVVQMIQGAHLRNAPPAAMKKPDGRERIDVERNQNTQAQRLEGRKVTP